MWSIEGFIIEAVEEGLEDVHGQDLVLALAITRGDVVLQLNRVSMPDSKPLLDEIHYRAAHKAAHWTSHQFRTGRFWKKSRRSVKEYEALIRQNLSILNPDPTPSPDKPG